MKNNLLKILLFTTFFFAAWSVPMSAQGAHTDSRPSSPVIDAPRSIYGGLFQMLGSVKGTLPKVHDFSYLLAGVKKSFAGLHFPTLWRNKQVEVSPVFENQQQVAHLPSVKGATFADVATLYKGKDFGPQGVFHKGLLGWKLHVDRVKENNKIIMDSKKKEAALLALRDKNCFQKNDLKNIQGF